MKVGHFAIIVVTLMTALLTANACAGAVDHYAVAATANRLFLLWAEGRWASTNTSALGIDLEGGGIVGSAITGVATFGEWIYLIDADTDSLIVGKLVSTSGGSYAFRKTRTIALESAGLRVDRPRALAVDEDGGVYVTGVTWTDGAGQTHSSYAYVNDVANDWSSPVVTVNIGEVANASMMDVAAHGSGAASQAVISHLLTGAGRKTHISVSSRGTTAGPKDLDGSYNPGAVATLTGLGIGPLAYVLSHRSSFDDTNMFGTLDVVSLTTMSVVGHYELPRHMDPQDVAVVQDGTDYYLAIIGTPKNNVLDPDGNLMPDPTVEPAQAWKIKLGGDGRPAEGAFQDPSTLIWDGTDHSGGQMIVASNDGQVIWTVHPDGTRQVQAWTFNTWASTSGTFTDAISDTVSGVARLLGLPSPVPEPSSLLSLAGFTGAALALLKRRKQ